MEKGMVLFDRRRLIRLIVPLVVEQVLAVTVGMADMVMASGAGEAAVSAGRGGHWPHFATRPAATAAFPGCRFAPASGTFQSRSSRFCDLNTGLLE